MARPKNPAPADQPFDRRLRALAARHGVEATVSARADGRWTFTLHGLDAAQVERILGALDNYGHMILGR